MGQYNRIADEILTLDTFPERFRIMDSEPEKRMELRRMLVDNYSVFYTIRDERVIVTDVLYTASDIEARLRASYKSTRLFEFYSQGDLERMKKEIDTQEYAKFQKDSTILPYYLLLC